MFKLTFIYSLLLRQTATQQHSYWTGMFVDDNSKKKEQINHVPRNVSVNDELHI